MGGLVVGRAACLSVCEWSLSVDSVLKAEFRAEVKSVLRVLLMFVPLPLFHALFDQQVSLKNTNTITYMSNIHSFIRLRTQHSQG